MVKADFVKEVASYGISSMKDEELVQGLVGAMDEEKAKEVAKAAMNKGYLTLEILESTGLKRNQAALILAGVELGRRCYYSKPVTSPHDIYNSVGYIGYQEEEHLMLITMNGAHEILKVNEITKGSINRTLIDCRGIIRQSLKDNAVAIAIAHNHPSGNLEPSPDDIEATRRVRDACKIVGITFLDHLIVGKGIYISMLERKII